MNETDTLKFLNNLQRFGWRFGLDNILRLLHEMGNPQAEFNSIHIAGTNGKGSTAAILESIYRYAGYKTGLFTSPHLVNINERIHATTAAGAAGHGDDHARHLHAGQRRGPHHPPTGVPAGR